MLGYIAFHVSVGFDLDTLLGNPFREEIREWVLSPCRGFFLKLSLFKNSMFFVMFDFAVGSGIYFNLALGPIEFRMEVGC